MHLRFLLLFYVISWKIFTISGKKKYRTGLNIGYVSIILKSLFITIPTLLHKYI